MSVAVFRNNKHLPTRVSNENLQSLWVCEGTGVPSQISQTFGNTKWRRAGLL